MTFQDIYLIILALCAINKFVGDIKRYCKIRNQ